ncbi:hypothetical protein GCM10027168_68230 [Streptomyces capparidis]
MTLAVMWEARAAEGRGEALLAWVRAQEPPARPLRREVFRAPGDRVLVITWWDVPLDAEVDELPAPPPDLLARPVHRWRFERVEDEPAEG